jgi:glycosyltransferase involved in cell wall biosynthesis
VDAAPGDPVLERLAARPDAPGAHDEAFLRWAAASDEALAGDVPLSRYLAELRAGRPDLLDAFPQVPGFDVAGLRTWARLHGRVEVPIPERFVPDEVQSPVATYAQAGVNLAGFFTAELGVGEVARRLALALRAASVPYATATYVGTANRTGVAFAGHDERRGFDTNLVCVNADSWGRFVQAMGPAFFAGRTTIGYWFWETTTFPSMFHSAFRGVDELWTASEYTAEVLRSAAPAHLPVHVVPVPIIEPATSGRDVRALVGLAPGRPYLLTSFDHNSVAERKNPAGAITAFRAAFPAADGPALIVKSINGDRHPAAAAHVAALAADRPDIVVHDGYLDAADNAALLAGAAAFVSLHRAEGLGLNLADAMALGVPVVCSAYSGNLTFVDPSDCWLVPIREIDVGPGRFPYEPHARWADPDLDIAAGALRAIVDDPDTARLRARRARTRVLRDFSPARCGTVLRDRVAAARGSREAMHATAPPPPSPTGRARASAARLVRAAERRLPHRPTGTVVCSIGSGAHEELLAIARPPLAAWATRYGYDLDLRHDLAAPERPASWSKVRLVRERLETHQVVIWVDADTVVVDGREDLARRVSRSRPIAMVAHGYAGQQVPNLGVFALWSCPRTKALLDTLWSMTEYRDHKWWENAALLDLLGYDIATEPIRKVRSSDLDARIEWLGNEWNSITLDPAEQPIIVHHPGTPDEDRVRMMRADVARWRAGPGSSGDR